MLLFVVICKIPDENKAPVEPEPIGLLSLRQAAADQAHHRSAMLGIEIKREHHSQGYGTEASVWAVEWAFKTANLHRVELHVLEWNARAQRVYEKIGFLVEGRLREALWLNGRWWDEIVMGMLDGEWEELRERHIDEALLLSV